MTLAYLDANFLIRIVESPGHTLSGHERLWDMAGAGRISVVTSWLTLSEVLVVPMRDKEDGLVMAYQDLFAGQMVPITLIDVSVDVLTSAARLRARWPALKLPDAVHLASAEKADCDVFVSGDRRLRIADAPFVIDPDNDVDVDRYLTAIP
ncbi:MAG: PIN domain-containing protein [Phreatobacter sp.]|uniref:type II toxin-antitoxin system VapC family toxin n=1 Tax=Phreatobacter sp. TaxID=1966341 RepID=UPI002732EF10|nr:PIN domain-containing protein [Phreatobacter sp.]MDP2801626.1 PIN domain-containing protein [Phreatobacter sp.]